MPRDREVAENVHRLLLDPVAMDASIGAPGTTASWCGPLALVAVFGLIVAATTTVFLVSSTLRDSSQNCSGWVRVHYELIAWLCCLSAVSGCFYVWMAVKKPRPRFVHIAGGFLISNTLSMSCMSMFFHTFCDVDWDPAAFHYKAAVVPGMIFNISAWAFLQTGILLKVEALSASRARVLRGLLMAIGLPGLLFVVLHSLVILGYLPGSIHLEVMLFESFLVIAITALFFLFTLAAARDMLRCRDLLYNLALREETLQKHRRTLAAHAAVTGAANGSSLLTLAVVAICLRSGFGDERTPWLFVATNAVDNLLNVLCMVLLSGLCAACRRRKNEDDVISEIALAGKVARRSPEASTFGSVSAAAHHEEEETLAQPPR